MPFNMYSPGASAMMRAMMGQRGPINPMSYDMERQKDPAMQLGTQLMRGTGNPTGSVPGAVRDMGEKLGGALLAGWTGKKYNDLEKTANDQWTTIMNGDGGLAGMQERAAGFGGDLAPKVAAQLGQMRMMDAMDEPNRAFQKEQWEYQKQKDAQSFALKERELAQNDALRRLQIGASNEGRAEKARQAALLRDYAKTILIDPSQWTPEQTALVSEGDILGFGKNIGRGAKDGAVKFDDVNGLGKRFFSESKDFQTINDSIGRLVSGSEADNAAGDLAIVFSYMKMLDPGSVVRESEYATAENARGVPEGMRNIYNKLLTGERLSPEQRDRFVGLGRDLYGKQRSQHDARIDYYKDLSGKYGIDPAHVIQDFTGPTDKLLSGYDERQKAKKLISQTQLPKPSVPGIGSQPKQAQPGPYSGLSNDEILMQLGVR